MRTKFIKIHPNEKTNSDKLNLEYTNIAEDISELYKNYISLKNNVEVHNTVLPANTASIESQIGSLQLQLDNIASNTSIFTMYDNTNIVYPDSLESEVNKCSYEQLFGQSVLPIASSDLSFHYIDPISGTRTLIDDIDKYVNSFITNNRYKPKINELYENTNINAIDATQDKSHLVKARTRNSNINDISIVYNIDTEGVKTINTVKVYPLPEMACSYEDLILSKSTGAKEGVKDNISNAVEFPIASARKRIFRFPDVDITGITLLLNNTNYTIIDNIGTKEFIIGSRMITLENTTYINTGYVGLKVSIPAGKTKIGKITPIYDGNASNIEVSVYNSLDEFDAIGDAYIMNGDAVSIQTVINKTISVDTIYILFKLTVQDNNTTPILKGCTITWL